MRRPLIVTTCLLAFVSLTGCQQFVPMVERSFNRVESFAGAATNGGAHSRTTAPGAHRTINTAAIRQNTPFAEADPFLQTTPSEPQFADTVAVSHQPPPADPGLTVLSLPQAHHAARPANSAGIVRLDSPPAGDEGGWQPTRTELPAQPMKTHIIR